MQPHAIAIVAAILSPCGIIAWQPPEMFTANVRMTAGAPTLQAHANISMYWSPETVAYWSSMGVSVYYYEQYGVATGFHLESPKKCAYFCKISAERASLPFSMVVNPEGSARSAVEDKLNDGSIDRFMWHEDLGPIVMSSVSLEIDRALQTPVRLNRKVTPFGAFLGWENATVHDFTPDVPPFSAWAGDLPLARCPEGSPAQCDAGGEELMMRAHGGDLHATLALGLREGVRKGGGPAGGMVREMPPWMPHIGEGGAGVARALAGGAGQALSGQVDAIRQEDWRREVTSREGGDAA